ncbi:hypothetical protein HK102_001154, partial [Quaeritorhiza haematococci]
MVSSLQRSPRPQRMRKAVQRFSEEKFDTKPSGVWRGPGVPFKQIPYSEYAYAVLGITPFNKEKVQDLQPTVQHTCKRAVFAQQLKDKSKTDEALIMIHKLVHPGRVNVKTLKRDLQNFSGLDEALESNGRHANMEELLKWDRTKLEAVAKLLFNTADSETPTIPDLCARIYQFLKNPRKTDQTPEKKKGSRGPSISEQ